MAGFADFSGGRFPENLAEELRRVTGWRPFILRSGILRHCDKREGLKRLFRGQWISSDAGT